MNFAEKKAIVVLGAGFGGLHTAIFLGRRLRSLHLVDRYKVILIDRNRYHTYTPTLYEIATASKETANYCDLKSIVTFPIEASTAGLPIAFLHGLIQLDPHHRNQPRCRRSDMAGLIGIGRTPWRSCLRQSLVENNDLAGLAVQFEEYGSKAIRAEFTKRQEFHDDRLPGFQFNRNFFSGRHVVEKLRRREHLDIAIGMVR